MSIENIQAYREFAVQLRITLPLKWKSSRKASELQLQGTKEPILEFYSQMKTALVQIAFIGLICLTLIWLSLFPFGVCCINWPRNKFVFVVDRFFYQKKN